MCFWTAHTAALFPEYQSVTKKDGIYDAILFSNALSTYHLTGNFDLPSTYFKMGQSIQEKAIQLYIDS